MPKRSRSVTPESTTSTTIVSDKSKVQVDDGVDMSLLTTFRDKFNEDKTNKLIQNGLCNGDLDDIAEVREYMQSLDFTFSNSIEPELQVTNQGLSGKCWVYSCLNVLRHEIIRQFQLPRDFELSEAYLGFWDKLERCNYVLSYFTKKDNIDYSNLHELSLLQSGCSDGGLRITCVNLIKKYGIIAKTSYRESNNSYDTEELVDYLNTKTREYSMELMRMEKSQRSKAKTEMLNEIFNFLAKMLGTPPLPNEKVNWSYDVFMDIDERLERVKRRRQNDDKYENLQLKRSLSITPLEFYEKFVVHNLEDYVYLTNDPRNPYHKYYVSYHDNVVVDGQKHGYYNVTMDEMAKYAMRSILDNTPVEFSCDVAKYNKPGDELLDIKCFNYDMLFGTTLQKLEKADRIRCLDSQATHAMVLVGVDLDAKRQPIKWKVENSWSAMNIFKAGGSPGYYTMANDWFNEYGFDVVVHRKYCDKKFLTAYDKAFQNAVVLPENDPMSE